MNKPKPSKIDSLKRLRENIPISCIVDVGVQVCTSELIKLFPDKKHYLIEPVPFFFEKIKENYKDVDHQILPYALADIESDAFIVMSSLHKNGKITHSHIRSNPSTVDGKHIIESIKIKVRRFDQLEISHKIKDDFLCKIDVDGQDLNVAKGFGEKIKTASAVIIEATTKTAPERMIFLSRQGFALFDIVDLFYYGQSLYQFDLIYVRNDLFTEVMSPKISDFKSELWHKCI